ncbi:MAG: M23 family metallopeptidase, partial [Vicinamibacteria bacterium]
MRAPALALFLVLASTACKREIVPEPYAPTGAHDAYRHALEQAGLHRTALGRDWAKAAEAALRSPVEVRSPFEETFHVDPAEAFGLGYKFLVKRGQRTEVKLEVDPPSDWRIFLDLFRNPESDEGIEQVASGGEGDMRLAFEPRRDGEYLLRVQSELLRGGSCTVIIRNVPSLEFPVAGIDSRAIGSSFGAAREGGRRSHHGVDIFAPRGTEVRAPSRARVRRVDDWKLGGRVIWLEDPERDLRLYFAHLETQEVVEGAWVAPGDRIGTVGNSGNARTTPPHLHFGIYVRGEGPVNPHPFLHHPRETAPPR